MELDGKSAIFLAAPFVVIALLVTAAYYVPFEKGLTEAEEGMLGFVRADLSVKKHRTPLTAKAGPGLFEFVRKRSEGGVVAESERPDKKGLTLIVVSGDRKMALIDDRLVKEGDRIDDKKIARIEPDRILVRDRTLKWEYLREE
jgi:hypothetical protein